MKRFAELVICLAIGVAASLWLGPDANWDLRNYHWYNVWALLNGRLDDDLLVASMQTYFNPLWDLPHYFIARYLGLAMAGAWHGAFYGGLLFLGLQIARLSLAALPPLGGRLGIYGLAVVATAFGATGVATLSEIGATFNDIDTGCFIAGAILLALIWKTRAGSLWLLALAGVLLGASAGLKLTNAVFAPGLVIALLAASPNRKGIVGAVLVCLGWGLGLLITYGWWGLVLFERFGNPTAPVFNTVFRSPWFPVAPFVDRQFSANSLWDVVSYPFRWALQPSNLVSEYFQHDPRIALGLLASILILAWPRLRRSGIGLVAIYLLVSYVVWVLQFGILRYAVILELLSGILTLAAVVALVARLGSNFIIAGAAAVAMTGVVIMTSGYMSWGRLPHGSSQYVTAGPSVPDGSLVLAVGPPLGIFVPYVGGSDLHFVGLNFVTRQSTDVLVGKTIADLIQAHAGKLFAIYQEATFRPEDLAPYRVVIDLDDCEPFEGPLPSFLGAVTLCRATRME
jgi:MFS family permease